MTPSNAKSDQTSRHWHHHDHDDALDCVGLSAPPNGQFAEHKRKDYEDQTDDVADYEAATTIGANLVGKFPDAAESHGSSDISKDKPGAAGPVFA